jgi:polar amino acid transport system substrate-binding protein
MAIAVSTVLPLISAESVSAATLDRVRQAGKLTLGYRVDARPFSYQDASGKAIGYAVALCERIAEDVKAELGLSDLTIDWVPVTVDDRFAAVTQGRVDLLCAPDIETLSRRKEVSFSVGIFPSGVGAVVRVDAPAALQDVLAGRPPVGPFWRGSPARVLEAKTFSVVKGTTSENWLSERLHSFQLDASVMPVENYDSGIKEVVSGDADVFFGDRSILLDAAAESGSAGELTVIDRLFTEDPLAFALQKNDDDFRLVVDRTLSRIFASGQFRDEYVKWFGPPDDKSLAFFRQSALPE